MTMPIHFANSIITTVDPSCSDTPGGCFSWAQAQAIYDRLVNDGLLQPVPTPADTAVLDAVRTWENVVANQLGSEAFAAASTNLALAARDRHAMLAPTITVVPG